MQTDEQGIQFPWWSEYEMALKTSVYTRTTDGSQIISLHENNRWLSNRQFTWEQQMALNRCFTWEKEMALKTLVYMKTWDGPQNIGLLTIQPPGIAARPRKFHWVK